MIEESLYIHPDTLRIDFRKGDTGSVCFRLNENLEDGIFWFAVKESLSQPDDEAPVIKVMEHPGGPLVLISIDEEESDRFSSETASCAYCNSYKDYIWGLKYAAYIYDEDGVRLGTGSVKTLIQTAIIHCNRRTKKRTQTMSTSRRFTSSASPTVGEISC
jgi:hypothetical protein